MDLTDDYRQFQFDTWLLPNMKNSDQKLENLNPWVSLVRLKGFSVPFNFFIFSSTYCTLLPLSLPPSPFPSFLLPSFLPVLSFLPILLASCVSPLIICWSSSLLTFFGNDGTLPWIRLRRKRVCSQQSWTAPCHGLQCHQNAFPPSLSSASLIMLLN